MQNSIPCSQQEALAHLSNWWQSLQGADALLASTEFHDLKRHIVVSGRPGVGKTYLTSKFIETASAAIPLFTAPTNEAVRQLELVLPAGTLVVTTYSALGLTMSLEQRLQAVVKASYSKINLSDYNLLIIDEASMVDEELAKYIILSGLPCIWLGDPNQLPPVSSPTGLSPIFTEKVTVLELTQVYRHGGQILNFVTHLRETIEGLPPRNLPKNIPANFGLRVLLRKNSFFPLTSSMFEALGAGKARFYVWTNKITDYCPFMGVLEYNQAVRGEIFGHTKVKSGNLFPTDRILFTQPLMVHKDIQSLTLAKVQSASLKIGASTNTHAEVLTVSPAKLLGINVSHVEVILETGEVRECFIVTSSEAVRKKLLCEKKLEEQALAATPHSYESKKCWKRLHMFRSLFARIQHTYCLTGHRAQGSSIERAYVDAGNILQNKNRAEAFKNLYVCCSRARKELVLKL